MNGMGVMLLNVIVFLALLFGVIDSKIPWRHHVHHYFEKKIMINR
jgi:hypothetical protein